MAVRIGTPRSCPAIKKRISCDIGVKAPGPKNRVFP